MHDPEMSLLSSGLISESPQASIEPVVYPNGTLSTTSENQPESALIAFPPVPFEPTSSPDSTITNGLNHHPETEIQPVPMSLPQVFLVTAGTPMREPGEIIAAVSNFATDDELSASTESVIEYTGQPNHPATFVSETTFTGLASTESVIEYAYDDYQTSAVTTPAEQLEETAEVIAAEPEIVTQPMTAAPIYKPIYTVERPDLLAGLTLEDDPHIQVSEPSAAPTGWRTWVSEGLLLGRDFFFAAVVAVLIVLFVVQPVKVEGTSMLPRLHDGERIFINKFIYQMEPIQRGDIVVFWYPKDPSKSFIKRVIGLPGDEVQLVSGKLRINGKPISESYLSKDYTTIAAPSHTWVVEPHHYFVMGDNRDASNDSRSWGLVPEKYIYGKAIYRYWPPSDAGSLDDDIKALKELKPVKFNPEE